MRIFNEIGVKIKFTLGLENEDIFLCFRVTYYYDCSEIQTGYYLIFLIRFCLQTYQIGV